VFGLLADERVLCLQNVKTCRSVSSASGPQNGALTNHRVSPLRVFLTLFPHEFTLFRFRKSCADSSHAPSSDNRRICNTLEHALFAKVLTVVRKSKQCLPQDAAKSKHLVVEFRGYLAPTLPTSRLARRNHLRKNGKQVARLVYSLFSSSAHLPLAPKTRSNKCLFVRTRPEAHTRRRSGRRAKVCSSYKVP